MRGAHVARFLRSVFFALSVSVALSQPVRSESAADNGSAAPEQPPNSPAERAAEAPRQHEVPIKSLTAEPVLVLPLSAFQAALESDKERRRPQPRELARRAALEIGAQSNARVGSRIRATGRALQRFSGEVFIVVPDATVTNAIQAGAPFEVTSYFVTAVRLEGTTPWLGSADSILSALGEAQGGSPCCGTSPGTLGQNCMMGPGCCLGQPGCLGPENPVFRTAVQRFPRRASDAIATLLPALGENACPVLPSLAARFTPSFASFLGSFGLCQKCTQVDCPASPPEPSRPTDHPRYFDVCTGSLPTVCASFGGDPEHLPRACGGSASGYPAREDLCYGPSPIVDVPCRYRICQQVADPSGTICKGVLRDSPEVNALLSALGSESCTAGGSPAAAPAGSYACCGGRCCTSQGGSRVCQTCGPGGCSPIAPWVEDEETDDEDDETTKQIEEQEWTCTNGQCSHTSCDGSGTCTTDWCKEGAGGGFECGSTVTRDPASQQQQQPSGDPPPQQSLPGSPNPSRDPEIIPTQRTNIQDRGGFNPMRRLEEAGAPVNQGRPAANQGSGEIATPRGKAADPVDLGSGALELEPVDLRFPSPVGALEFQRFYNSRSDDRSVLGSNWVHSYDVRLERVTAANAPDWAPRYCTQAPRNANGEELGIYGAVPFIACLVLHEPRGSVFFYFDPATRLYLPQAGSTDTARAMGQGWAVRSPDGRIRLFNDLGYLVSDRDRFGNGYTIGYEETPLYLLYRRYCGVPTVRTFDALHPRDPSRSACNALGHMTGEASRFTRFTADPVLPPDPTASVAVREARAYFEWLLGREAFGLAAYGDRKLRAVVVRDDTGRELRFEYYWPARPTAAGDFVGMASAGLLRRVRGPAGVALEFAYRAPAGYPAFQNERFLVEARRADAAVTAADLETAAPRRSTYGYQWPESIARSYNAFAADYRARYARFYSTFIGCASCPDSARSCSAMPNVLLVSGSEPCWLALLQTHLYRSKVADNIVTVRFQDRIRLESRYDPDPNHVDTFDRVLAQRYGGAPTDTAANDVHGPWLTTLPLHRLDYRFAGPTADGGDLTDAFLPAEIRERYLLEASTARTAERPPCNEPGSGCVGRDASLPELPVCPASSVRPRVPAFPETGLPTARRPCCRPDLMEEYRTELPGHRPLLDYYPAPPAAAAATRLLRSRLSCGQIAERHFGDATHNDSLSTSPAVGASYEVAIGRRAPAARDAARICQWVQDVDADGIVTIRGLNFQGRVLVRASELPQPNPSKHQFVFAETIYNADGLPVEERRPTSGPAPWHADAGYTALVYDEIDPTAANGWNRVLPAFWARRMNLVETRDVPQSGHFVYDNKDFRRQTATARVQRMLYEPLFNQLQRYSAGIVSRTYQEQLVVHHEFDYQELSLSRDMRPLLKMLRRWGFSWLTRGADELDFDRIAQWQLPLYLYGDHAPSGTMVDMNGDRDAGFVKGTANAPRRARGVPVRTWVGRPSEWRVTLASWAPHGRPAFIVGPNGARTVYEYFRGAAAPFTAYPPTIAPRSAYRGFLGRITRYGFGGTGDPATPVGKPPCAKLKGPYQWLLPSDCSDLGRELVALRLPADAIGAIQASVGSTPTFTRPEVETFAYNRTGAVSRYERDGQAHVLTRDTDGRLRRAADPLGVRRTLTYDGDGNLREMSVRGPQGARLGLLRVRHDRADRETLRCMALDAQGCPIPGLDEASDHSLIDETTYSPGGRIVRRRNATGRESVFSYDRRGSVEGLLERAPDAPDRQQRFTYTADGNVAHVRHGTDDTRGGLGSLDEQFEYDGLGQLARSTDRRRLSTWFARTPLGDVSRLRKGSVGFDDQIAPPLWEQTFAFNAHREVIGTVVQNTEKTVLVRDATGSVVSSQRTGSAPVFSSYDHSGRLVWRLEATGQQRVWTWDPGTRISTESIIRPRPEGGVLTTTQRREHDALLRVVSERLIGNDGVVAEESRRLRPSDGQVLRQFDPDGYVTVIQRNWAGWPTTVSKQDHGAPGSTTPADHELTHITYRDAGRHVEFLDDQSRLSVLRFNGFAQLSVEQFPGMAARLLSYDGYGRLARESTPAGVGLAYGYDERGDLRRVYLPSPPELRLPPVVLIERQYDALGRVSEGTSHHPYLAAAKAGESRRTLDYDELGRTRAETFRVGPSAGMAVRSQWMPAGRPEDPLSSERLRRTITVGDEAIHTEEYDASLRLRSVDLTQGQVRFHWAGNLYAGRSFDRGDRSSTVETAGFDSFARRTDWIYGHQRGGGARDDVFARVLTHRDKAGRVRSRVLDWTPRATGAAPDNASRWRGYMYDAAGRLATEFASDRRSPDVSTIQQAAIDDATVARLAQEVGAEPLTVQRNQIGSALRWTAGTTAVRWEGTRDQHAMLRHVALPAGASPVVRDKGGRVASALGLEFQYDALDRLAIVTRNGTLLESYAYTDDGRISATLHGDGVEQRFAHDGRWPLAGQSGSDRPDWLATWGPGTNRLTLLRQRDRQPAFVLLDHRHSVVGTDTTGQIVDRTDYGSHGTTERLSPDGSVECAATIGETCPRGASPFGFAGAWRSDRTGLVLMGTRWYSPELQEFLTPDRAGIVDGSDIFGYAAFDPVNRWDPTGSASERIPVEDELPLVPYTPGAPGYTKEPPAPPLSLKELTTAYNQVVASGALDPKQFTYTDRQAAYGATVERLTGGKVPAILAIMLNPSGGMIGPGAGGLAQVLTTVLGSIEAVSEHGVAHDAAGWVYRNVPDVPSTGYHYAPVQLPTLLPPDNPAGGQIYGLFYQLAISLEEMASGLRRDFSGLSLERMASTLRRDLFGLLGANRVDPADRLLGTTRRLPIK
jgi:RHS repeat-associated protein